MKKFVLILSITILFYHITQAEENKTEWWGGHSYVDDSEALKLAVQFGANWQKSTAQLEKLVNTSYENGYKQCKEDMTKGYV
jgi:hypothetical protein